MGIGKIFRDAVSYIPVVRAVVDIVSCIIRISAGAVNEVETQVKSIESISRWLRDNDVNTFSEYYDKQFERSDENETL